MFDVGPDVCSALQSLCGQPQGQVDSKPPLHDNCPSSAAPDPPPPSLPVALPPGFRGVPWPRLS
jgi:hypothetical protein